SQTMKKTCDNILETIGHTPMVRLNKVTATVPATVYAKVETFNPGHSIKDRMALKMVEDAEKSGKLKPGGTIIEGTSGNTGMGLAIAGIVKGYRCIFTTTDKQSKGKIDRNEIYPYVTEGIGEDFIPQNFDFNIIDHFEKVTDKDAALMTREIVRQEGIWVGNSAGSAVAGLIQMKDQLKKSDVVVII